MVYYDHNMWLFLESPIVVLFFVLPLLSLFATTRPVPTRIGEPVLGGGAAAATADQLREKA